MSFKFVGFVPAKGNWKDFGSFNDKDKEDLQLKLYKKEKKNQLESITEEERPTKLKKKKTATQEEFELIKKMLNNPDMAKKMIELMAQIMKPSDKG